MKRSTSWLILVALLITVSVLTAANANAQAKYKVVEVKHLTKADGVNLSAETLNDIYDKLREDLATKGIFGAVVEDGGTISDADAANAVVLECKIIKFSKDSLAIGEVQEEVILLSRGDHKLIQQFTTVEMPVNIDNWGIMARATGHYLAEAIRRFLK
jgi:hypothetical protein